MCVLGESARVFVYMYMCVCVCVFTMYMYVHVCFVCLCEHGFPMVITRLSCIHVYTVVPY